MTNLLLPDVNGTTALQWLLGDPNAGVSNPLPSNFIPSGAEVITFGVSGGATTVYVSSLTPFGAGQTILIDSEYMLVTGVNVGGGYLNVTRGTNNSSIATHNIGTPIYVSQVVMLYNNAGVLEVRDASGNFLVGWRANLVGGSLNGVVIGGTTPAAVTGTSLKIASGGQGPIDFFDAAGVATHKWGRYLYDGGETVAGGGWVWQTMTDAGAYVADLNAMLQSNGYLGMGTLTPVCMIDAVGTIRATSQTVPTSGAGAELYNHIGTAHLLGYDRGGGVVFAVDIDGLTLNLKTGSLGAVTVGGKMTVKPGTSTGTAALGGAIFDHVSAVSNTGTGDTTLWSDTVPANAVASNGDMVHAVYSLIGAANGNNKNIAIYLDGLLVFRSTNTTTIGSAIVQVWYEYIGGTTVNIWGFMLINNAVQTFHSNGTAWTPSLAHTVELHAQGGASGDVTAETGKVYWQSAA